MGKPRRDGIAAILASGQFPGVVVRGTHKGHHANIHATKANAAPNCTHGIRSPKEQEKFDKHVHAKKRKRAEDEARRRRGTRRADDEMRHVGHIPFNVHGHLIKKHGREWLHNTDTKKILSDYDLAFKE